MPTHHLSESIRWLQNRHDAFSTPQSGPQRQDTVVKHTLFETEKTWVVGAGVLPWWVAWWQRICLSMQETWIWSLVLEDPTCRGTTKPLCHNYWTCALEPKRNNYRAHMPQLEKTECSRAYALQKEKLLQWEASAPQLQSGPHSCPQLEKSPCSNELWHSQINKLFFLKRKYLECNHHLCHWLTVCIQTKYIPALCSQFFTSKEGVIPGMMIIIEDQRWPVASLQLINHRYC